MPVQSTPETDRRHSNRAIGTFFVLLCVFSAIAYGLTIHLHKQPPMLSRIMMWCPGAAALATCALLRLPQATLGWRWPKARWLVFAYLVPLLYALSAYGATWSVIAGSLAPTDFLQSTAQEYGFASRPLLATALIGVPLLATAGIVSSVTWGLGEEIGWRGFLLPRLTERLGFPGACLASGLIWAAWHYPILLWADYNAGTDPVYALACFTAMVVAMGFILGWLRLRSGSVWPCALFHASHNQFVQGVFDPLTANVGASRLVTTEFGCGLALTVGVVAAILVTCFPVAPQASAESGCGPSAALPPRRADP